MSEALKLMFTGMGTVFFILIMVVVLGNLIIRLTNSFATETVKPAVVGASSPEMAPNKLAAIVTAVDVVTQGRGKVSSVEKLSE